MALQQIQHENKNIQKNQVDRFDIIWFRITVYSSVLAIERSMVGQRYNGDMFGGGSDEIVENKVTFSCSIVDNKFIDLGGYGRHIYPLCIQGVIQQLCYQHIPKPKYSSYALNYPLIIQTMRLVANYKYIISRIAAIVSQKIRRKQIDKYISTDRFDIVLFGFIYMDVD